MSKQPDTEQAIAEIWSDDVLGRRVDAEYLLAFLEGRIAERGASGKTRSFVINIDAGWGHGKTFFLDRLAETLAAQSRIAARINAWRDDHADDPLLPIMAGIDAALNGATKVSPAARNKWKAAKQAGTAVAVAAAKGAAMHLTSKLLGEGAREIADILGVEGGAASKASAHAIEKKLGELFDKNAESLLDKFKENKKSIDQFRTQLSGALEKLFEGSHDGPLYVLLDELDRCRPPYAIAMLERAKHLFDINDVVFVIATDSLQLQHAIKAVYGSEFDSKRYLFRFFDRTFTFEKPETASFIKQLLADQPISPGRVSLPPDCELADFLARGADHLRLGLRDVEQALDLLRSVVTSWKKPTPLELVALYPLVLLQQQRFNISSKISIKSEFEQLAANNPHGIRPWRVRFSDRSNKPNFSTIPDLFQRFHEMASPNLIAAIEREYPSGGSDRWIRSRLDNEFQSLHAGGYNSRNPPRSIILDYPLLVRNAGRIHSEAEAFDDGE